MEEFLDRYIFVDKSYVIIGNLGETPSCPPLVVSYHFRRTINSNNFNKIINKNHLKRSEINEVTFFR